MRFYIFPIFGESVMKNIKFKFFVGMDEQEVDPTQNNTASRYIRYLKEAITALIKTQEDNVKRDVLQQFQINTESDPLTKRMFQELKSIFIEMLDTKPLPSTDEIVRLLRRPSVPKRGYIEIQYEYECEDDDCRDDNYHSTKV